MEKETIEKTAERSVELFVSGYYCAESVLLAIAGVYEIQSKLIPKIATGFCSGTSRMSGQCGAVNGAILSINLLTGRNDPNSSVEENYTLVSKFLNNFVDKFGSTNCQELIGCDLGTKEGQSHFKTHNLEEDCFAYTKEATRMALSILNNKQ